MSISKISVAIIGAGPAGFYAADALIKKKLNCEIDIIDFLPTPYGLIRAGVAPDHQTTKKVTKSFEKVALNESCNFFGNVHLGNDISIEELKTIYDVLNGNCSFEESIQNTNIQNLKVVSSNVDLSGLEVETAKENRRAFLLKDKMDTFVNSTNNDFSYILIDCPPSLSLLTVMALVSAKSLIVPLQAEFFALEGLSQLIKTIDRVKENLNPNLYIRGVLLTMFDKRNKLSSEVDREARDYFKEKVYQTVIQRNVRLSEAPSHGLPCVVYDKNCVGSKSYFKLAEEFLKKTKLRALHERWKKKGLRKRLVRFVWRHITQRKYKSSKQN